MCVCRTVSEILSIKEWRNNETGGRGRSKSLKMVSFDRLYTTFYWSAIVSIAVCCIIFKLFDVESSWPWKSHWRSFKLIPFESLGAVSYLPSTQWRSQEFDLGGIRFNSLQFQNVLMSHTWTKRLLILGVYIPMYPPSLRPWMQDRAIVTLEGNLEVYRL